MTSSHCLVYSVATNVAKAVRAKQSAAPFTPHACLPRYIYDKRVRSIIKHNCVRIFSDIESGLYTYDDFVTHALYVCMFEPLTSYEILKKTTAKNVSITIKKMSLDQFIIDKQFILDLDAKLQLKDIKHYFAIDSEGTSIAARLVKDGYVQPLFYVRLNTHAQTENSSQERVEHESSEEHQYFTRVMTLLSTHLQTLQGATNG